jgi:hypothetical protein
VSAGQDGGGVWDGYPPDRSRDGWHWLAQATCEPCPAFWCSQKQEWQQGGLLCGGAAPPSFLTSRHFVGGVNWIGVCPEPAARTTTPPARETDGRARE